MAFKRIKGGDRGNIECDISSLAFAIGDLAFYDRSNHVVIKGTSTTPLLDLAGVVVAATTTADTKVLLQAIFKGDEYIADLTNNSNSAHNYQGMVLTDEHTVNNTGTTSNTDYACCMQIAPVGAAGDKKAIVSFVQAIDN